MLISSNSYFILSLDQKASEILINKRYHEILKLLKIDEPWEFETDISWIDYRQIRNEESTKEAFTKLTNNNTKVKESLLWFQLTNNKDRANFKKVTDWDFKWALEWRRELFENTKNYHYLQNTIVLRLLMFEQWLGKFRSDELVDDIYNLRNTDAYWSEFEMIFKKNNKIEIKSELLNKVKKSLPKEVAESLFDACEIKWTYTLINKYEHKFWISADELEDNTTVTKTIQNISNLLEEISQLDYPWEIELLFNKINKINNHIEDLNSKWLSNSETVIKIKDKSAEEVRSIGIAFFNKYDDAENAINIINESIILAYSENIKGKGYNDIENISSQTKWMEWIKNFLEKFNKWHEALEAKRYDQSIQYFKNCIDIFHEEIGQLFSSLSIEQLKELNNVISEYFSQASNWDYLVDDVINVIDKIKWFLNEDGSVSIKDRVNIIWLTPSEVKFLIIYIDAVSYVGLSKILKNKNSFSAPTMWTLNGCWTRLYWDTLYFTLLRIPILPISRYKVIDRWDGSYQFLDKYKLHQWQKIWFWVMLVIIWISLLSLWSMESNNSSYSSSSSYSSNSTSTYSSQPETCLGSNWYYNKRPINAKCNWATNNLWWSCNYWYKAIQWNGNVGWYCKCISEQASCSQYTDNYLNVIESELNILQNTIQSKSQYVNEYSSQYAIDEYNSLIDQYNEKLSKYNKELSEKCECL